MHRCCRGEPVQEARNSLSYPADVWLSDSRIARQPTQLWVPIGKGRGIRIASLALRFHLAEKPKCHLAIVKSARNERFAR